MASNLRAVSRGATGLVFLLSGASFAGTALADAPTFDQVLTAPDDPSLNLAYAEAESNRGNLLSAAAALERILLAHPNAHSVRLFYAVVLYRLNDLKGANQQLRLLDHAQLTPLQTAERNKYEALVVDGQSDTRLTGTVGVGVAVDSDAIGALLNQTDFFPGSFIQKNGAAFVGTLDVNLSHDLTPNGDLQGFTSASIYTRTSFAGPNADFETGEFKLGLLDSQLMHSWQVNAVFRHMLIFDQPYETDYGLQAQATWRTDTSLSWLFGMEVVGQSYHEPLIRFFVDFDGLPGTQDGTSADVHLGATYRIDSRQTLSATVGLEMKQSAYDAFAYDAPYVSGNYHALLGDGVYVDVLGDLRYVDYRARDYFFLFNRQRIDVRSDARVALGAPLSAFSEEGATGDYLENLILESSVNFEDRTSRFPLAPFHSVGGELRLVWKFGTGL